MTKLIIAGLLFGSVGLAAADGSKPHHKPPQEAIDACAKSAKADPCAFTHDNKDVKGTCKERKHGPGLVCRGEHAPKPPKAS